MNTACWSHKQRLSNANKSLHPELPHISGRVKKWKNVPSEVHVHLKILMPWSSRQISWQKGGKDLPFLTKSLSEKMTTLFLQVLKAHLYLRLISRQTASFFCPCHISPHCYVLCGQSSLHSPAVAAEKWEQLSGFKYHWFSLLAGPWASSFNSEN